MYNSHCKVYFVRRFDSAGRHQIIEAEYADMPPLIRG